MLQEIVLVGFVLDFFIALRILIDGFGQQAQWTNAHTHTYIAAVQQRWNRFMSGVQQSYDHFNYFIDSNEKKIQRRTKFRTIFGKWNNKLAIERACKRTHMSTWWLAVQLDVLHKFENRFCAKNWAIFHMNICISITSHVIRATQWPICLYSFAVLYCLMYQLSVRYFFHILEDSWNFPQFYWNIRHILCYHNKIKLKISMHIKRIRQFYVRQCVLFSASLPIKFTFLTWNSTFVLHSIQFTWPFIFCPHSSLAYVKPSKERALNSFNKLNWTENVAAAAAEQSNKLCVWHTRSSQVVFICFFILLLLFSYMQIRCTWWYCVYFCVQFCLNWRDFKLWLQSIGMNVTSRQEIYTQNRDYRSPAIKIHKCKNKWKQWIEQKLRANKNAIKLSLIKRWSGNVTWRW